MLRLIFVNLIAGKFMNIIFNSGINYDTKFDIIFMSIFILFFINVVIVMNTYEEWRDRK